MTFPSSPLDLRCELDLGGTQTDVSSYVYQRDGQQPPVTIARGHQDESSQVNPATVAWEWNNRDGRFAPKNPLSPYFGQLGRNTPVRFSVPAAAPGAYLRLENDRTSYATCPDAAALRITGDMDVRIDLKLSSYVFSALADKAAGSQTAWLLDLEGDGTLQFFWWDAGLAQKSVRSTMPIPVGRIVLRATLSVATGTVTFWTGPDIVSGPWTQLGAAASGTGGAATTVFAGTAPLVAGDNASAPNGAVFSFQLRNGINGTTVAFPSFATQSPGATSFPDGLGNTWTLAGTAEISGRDFRVHALMSAQPPAWDVTGNDQAVKATAGGLMRLLGQGTSPVQSPMKRAVMAQAGNLFPEQYWTCEDAAGASSLGSSAGGAAMTFDANPAPKLAADSSFLCSAPLPQLNGTRMHGTVPTYGNGGALVCRFLCKLGSTLPASNAVLMRLITTGTCREFTLRAYNGGGLGISGWDASGNNVFDTGGVAFAAGGQPLWYSMEATPVSGGQQFAIVTLAPGASTGSSTSATVLGGIHGNVTDVWVNPSAFFTDTVVGHIQVQQAWVSLFSLASPLNAWQGEKAGDRFYRLATENGYQARVYGSPSVTAAMGAQGVDTLPNLLQECEDADQGLIYEPRQSLSLGYRTLASMLNQVPAVTGDYAQAQPGGVDGNPSDSGLDPTYDDQLTRNDWTVTRGASAGSQGATVQFQLDDGSAMSVSQPPAGVGDYADSKTVNVQSDSQLPDAAGWRVHRGTVDEARWPAIPWNLARPQIAAASLYYPVIDADIGDYAELVNLPHQVTYDPVKQLVYGVTEKLGGFHHTVEWAAVPESPCEVIVLDDPVYGRVDTDGSSLHANITAGATTLQADTAAGFPLWTTAAADFPFDIKIAGERMTVTNIDGPPANFLTGDNAGFEASAGNWTGGLNCSVAFSSAQAHSGTHSLAMTSAAAGTMTAASCLAGNIATQGLACAAGDVVNGAGWFLAAAAARSCLLQIGFYTAGAVLISTASGTAVTDATTGWVKAVISATAPATTAFARLITSVQSTGGAGEVHYADDCYLADVTTGGSSQTMTVTRAVNGVPKSQSAGADVRLWFPPVLSLI